MKGYLLVMENLKLSSTNLKKFYARDLLNTLFQRDFKMILCLYVDTSEE